MRVVRAGIGSAHRGEWIRLVNRTGEPVVLVTVFAAGRTLVYPVRITAGGIDVAVPARPKDAAHG